MGRIGLPRRLAALAIAACAAALAPAPAAAAPAAPNPGHGSEVRPVGRVEAPLLIPGPGSKSKKSGAAPFRSVNPSALRASKLKADAAAAATSTAPAAAAATSASAAGLWNGLDAAGFAAADEGYSPTPPDATGAIGPTRYLEFVNNLVGVYDRGSLARLSSTDLGTFSAIPSGTTSTDPQVQWDPQGNRWLYANISFSSNFATNYILFGWSKTSDPSDLTNGWCHYAISTGSNIPDFPKLGHDANFVMVGVNDFDGSKSTLPFVTADIWAMPKPPASQSTCAASVTTTHFADAGHLLKNADGTLAATPVPANTVDSSANGYIVSAHDPSASPQSKAMVWQMTAGPKLVALGDISVGAAYSVPPSVPQPGTGYLIDTLDGRFTQAVANFDPAAGAEAVWTQHTVAASGRSEVRWYEFLPATMAIRQQGQVASSTDYYWNAAISPSIAGNDAVIEYNRGSSSQLPVIGAQSRSSSTALGQMDPGEVLIAASNDADQETLFQGNCTPNPCRWGDYSGAAPDPLNPGVVFGASQVTGPSILGLAQWQTQIFAITTAGTPPAAPLPPAGLSAAAIDATRISLAWSASTGATSYKVQRSPDGSTGWTQVGTSSAAAFTDSGLSPTTTYFYRVAASNSVGDSGPSNVASAKTAAALSYSQSPQGSWLSSYGADGYALLGWGNSELVSLPQSTLTVDQGAFFEWNGSTAAVQALQSPDGSTRHAASVYDASQVRLHLTFSSAYAGTLHIYALDWDSRSRLENITVNDGSGPQTATITTDFTQGAWVNAPINVAAGGTVTVTATLTGGLNAVLSGLFLGGASVPPAPPAGLTATAISATQVKLAWTASSGASGYKVQRSPDGSTGWAQVGTSTTATFTDSNLVPSTTYFYRVLASSGPADSAPSSVASATTAAGLPYSQSPQGTWVGNYGGSGYALLGWGNANLVSLPQSTLTVDQGAAYEWSSSTTAVQALQSPDATTRHAATLYDGSQVRVHLVFSSAYSGTAHVYALDWDGRGRREIITIDDGSGPQTANLTTDFSQGAWVNVPINVATGGTLTVTVTLTGGLNAVLSGVFLGTAPPPTAPGGLTATALNSSQISLGWSASSGANSYKVQRSPDGSTGWTQVAATSSTVFTDSGLNPSTTYFYRVLATNGAVDSAPSNVASATTLAGLAYTQAPQGSWVGTYGADGYALLGWGNSDLVSLPQSTLTVDQGAFYEWTGSTTAAQALQSPDGSTRHAAAVYDANQVRLHLTFSSAYSGALHVYAVDWDSRGRLETITVNDGSGPRTATITTDMSQGVWVSAPISVAAGGTVTVTVTLTGGLNAVLSGLFLGGAPALAAPAGLTASAVDVSRINLTWAASAGANSYKVQRSPDGSTGWTQVGTSSGTAFTDSGLTAATTYFYRVLAGNSAGDSAPSAVASAKTATLVAYSQSPQGTWVGTYGARGYVLFDWTGSGDLVSLPQCTITIDQGARYQWSGSTTAVQALESPDATTRRAAAVYDGSQVRVHLTFSSAFSGNLHLYAVDWDGQGRRETVLVNDGTTLQEANVTTDFTQGAWINVPVSVAAGGTITITVTTTAGPNAVLSGVFLG